MSDKLYRMILYISSYGIVIFFLKQKNLVIVANLSVNKTATIGSRMTCFVFKNVNKYHIIFTSNIILNTVIR